MKVHFEAPFIHLPATGTSLIVLLLLIFFIQACGVARTGTERTPARTADVETVRILQSGVASWYGSKFHGKSTANGETYNMNDFTAAHRTLPFNTVVKVENMDNGKSVVVRINDRGPYVGNRVIDLSRRAAREIDMENAGTANVQIHLVEDGDRPVTDRQVTNKETYTVQLASFNSERDANAFSGRVSNSRVERVNFGNNTAYRVYYGTYSSITDARAAQQRLASQGYDGFVKQAEN
ncbi:septal ring lytic transglycosylase RlpA family protein [soil metagenome]